MRVGVRVNKPEALDGLADYFPPGWKQSSSPVVERLYSFVIGGSGSRPGIWKLNLLYADGNRIARSRSLDDVLNAFEGDLQLCVAERAPRRVFIHAGVVGWNGEAILIPGRSFTGKTTLVSELVRAGATYYSDEYAVLDARGRVHPYSRPLGLRGTEDRRQKKYRAEELGGRTGVKPLPVGLIVVSKYKAGAKWRPRPLSPGQGALALLDNTVSIRRQPTVALDAVQQAVSQAPVIKGVRGEAHEVVGSILNELRGHSSR